MRGSFRGLGAAAVAAAMPGVPMNAGGNAVQGNGIVFTYQTPNIATLTHLTASGAQVIQFDNNSTFLWLRSTFTFDVSAATVTNSALQIPHITVTIADTGNGMQFMNAGIPVYEIAGTQPGLPYILPTPQLIQPNASYSWNFSSYEAAVDFTNVRFQLHGFRIFRTDLSSVREAMQALAG
jgi:hypothetical protein